MNAKLRRLTRSKGSDGRLTPAFLCKIALSHPSVSARGFTQTWRDLVGEKTLGCSRLTIDKVRDAFAVTAAECVHGDVAAQIAASAKQFAADLSTAADGARGHPVWSCALLHIQDEASLRLRSFAAGGDSKTPVRSRASKVQQHAMWLLADGRLHPLLSELDPLSDKTARTVATSLKKAVSSVIAMVHSATAEALSSAGCEPWFIHVIVGDGIQTNEAACRILRAAVKAEGLPGRMRYLILVVKCCNHQSNLVVGSLVQGRAALTRVGVSAAVRQVEDVFAAQVSALKASGPHKSVCGTIVRLFKYLVSDYYSEFLVSLHGVVNRLTFTAAVAHDRSSLWSDMALLYGSRVLPAEVLRVLNAGCDSWVHVSTRHDDEGYRCEAREALLSCLRKHILTVDEHPTLSRFWTFAGHVDRLLLIHLLQVYDDVFKITTVEDV